MMQSAIYPLIAALNRGLPVDVIPYLKSFGIPVRADGKADPAYPPALGEDPTQP